MNGTGYPQDPAARDAWIVRRRPGKNRLDPFQAYGAFSELEPDETGQTRSVATILLTNRECPWRCLMCDLWRNTLDEPLPTGAIPRQIAAALLDLGAASWLKLYNAGSFFDLRAIPPPDYEPVAQLASGFDRVIVESHPALLGERCLQFQRLLKPQLEVAMGLETADPVILEKLNKRMTRELFARGAEFLQTHGIGLRVFVLIQPPFSHPDAAVELARRSAAFAFECGAGIVALIPTRPGNGALDALIASGDFSPPALKTVEDAFDGVLALRRGRVVLDLWELERFSRCPNCFPERRVRLERMNLGQEVLSRVGCDCDQDPDVTSRGTGGEGQGARPFH